MRLFDNRGDETELLRDAARLGDLIRRPLAGAPVHGPPLDFDHVVERADGFLHRSQAIRAVRIHNVDVFQVQPLQRGFETLDNVLAREAVVVDEDLAVGAAPVELGGHDDVVAVPVVLLDGLAHDDLGLASGIGFSCVEEVDTAVVGLLHAGKCELWNTSLAGCILLFCTVHATILYMATEAEMLVSMLLLFS